MATTLRTTAFRSHIPAARHAHPVVMRGLRLTFISGPKVLLTSRISAKCALVMALMCLPSLSCCFLLTIPGLIFQSPQQQAYFYFSKVLNEDPSRWICLLLAGLCALLSLAVPAILPGPSRTSIWD